VINVSAGAAWLLRHPASTRLARLEMRVLLNVVLDRLPGLRLDPDAHDPHIHGLIFRSPPNLPVRFDPA
jgi:cytochrome P450